MADSMKEATGKVQLTVFTPEERWEKLNRFVLIDKPFKENTKNGKMSEMAATLRHSSIQEAIEEYSQEGISFVAYFKEIVYRHAKFLPLVEK